MVDGFPRNIEQAKDFTKEVSDVEFVLYFDCPEEELMQRLLARGETSGRSDDNTESIRKRFQTFNDTCKPVVDMLADEGKVHAIDATRTEDEIFTDICPLFEKAFATASR